MLVPLFALLGVKLIITRVRSTYLLKSIQEFNFLLVWGCDPIFMIITNQLKKKRWIETFKKIMGRSLFICTVSNGDPITWDSDKQSAHDLSLRAFVHLPLIWPWHLSASDWRDTLIGDIFDCRYFRLVQVGVAITSLSLTCVPQLHFFIFIF